MIGFLDSILDRRDVFRTLIDYQNRYGNPLGISRDELSSWSSGLDFNGDEGTYIYTGSLYQMAAWMSAYSSRISKLESGHLPTSSLLMAARGLGSIFGGLPATLSGVSGELRQRCTKILRRASKLLYDSGISHGYMGGSEPYSGVIFMEMGLTEYFSGVATRAYKEFKAAGVKRLITLDPHSTVALREWYPEYVNGFDIEVTHYLEVSKPSNAMSKNKDHGPLGNVGVHDPCLLSRRLDLDDKLRDMLTGSGLLYTEPTRCRKGTFCCGGPIEGIAPVVAGEIANKRKEQLKKVCERAVASCPVCLANLNRKDEYAGGRQELPVFDLLEVI